MLGRHALAEKVSFLWRKVLPCTAYSSYLGRANFLTKLGEISTRRNKKLALLEGRPAYQGHSFSMVS